MTWWFYLLIACAVLLISLLALGLLLPVRIIIRYLRKNKEDRVTVVAGQLHWEIRFDMIRYDGEKELSISTRLAWWRFRIPVMRRIIRGQESIVLRLGRWEHCIQERSLFQSLASVGVNIRPLARRTKPFLKKLSVERMNLKIAFGFADPSVTGIVAGGCWALAGLVTGLFKRNLTFATAPRIWILPDFNGEPLRIQMESSLAMPLFRWLQLWLVTRKIGGVSSGSSSH